MLIYLINGTLPWILESKPDQHPLQFTKAQKYQLITDLKKTLTPKDIAGGLPIEFEDLLFYARSLAFTDRPDYSFIKKMLDSVLFRAQYTDFTFDWRLLHKKEAVVA